MPFSWKKSRCNRFHQLVTDHLQSPKHGGSLVVETGFPTSLIDLYVRNRSRFRKPAVNKQTEIDSPLSPVSSDSNNLSFSLTDHRETDEIIEEDVVAVANDIELDVDIENSSEVEVKRSVVMEKLNYVLVVLFMLVLALGNKKFTVGISVSAFVLLSIELIRKPLLSRRSSSISPNESSDCEIENVKSIKEDASDTVCSKEMEIEEEEEVESKQEVKSEKISDVLMNARRKSSRRAVMKSKIKKLVPKKLRKSSVNSKEDLSCEIREQKVMKRVQDVKPLVMSSECSDTKGKTLSILKQDNDEIVSLSSKIDCRNKDVGRRSQQNSGYLVLCLIVLVGLIEGRVLALVLALSWCLIMKRLQCRNMITICNKQVLPCW
ncbi:uncharacterized protein [Rutidosis leptorrhynchoides]|uniref:uncharacterized protein n=1 Tax=Rutidosis leptorrhynchoides TaxID=125765 RepID=UPI003A9A1A59